MRRHPDRPAKPNTRRRLIQGAGGVFALGLAPQIVRGATLLALRVWPAPEYTRVTIEHDAPLKFSHFILRDSQPLRLVVDIEGIDLNSRFADQVRKVDAADPFIARLRVAQFRPQVVRLVIDLKTPVDPQVFALDPAGPYRNRLIVDLYPEGANDSLMALLREQENGQRDPIADALDQRAHAPADPGQVENPDSTASAPAAQSPSTAAPTPDAASPASQSGPAAEPAKDAPARVNRSMRRLITIAIDAGHGGEDPGATGRHGTHEKVVTLSIARRLASLLDDGSDYRVLLTRDGDYFVPLGARVQKAQRVQADLFVSIHADAWVRSDARGSSVFALSQRGASSAAAAEIARHENYADVIGGINLPQRTAHDVKSVVLDLATSAQISDSLRLGDAMLHELERVNRLHRGFVEQAGFAVLKAPTIPSILVETAFISNPDEEMRLRDENYQRQMASALYSGIRSYFAANPPAVRNPVG